MHTHRGAIVCDLVEAIVNCLFASHKVIDMYRIARLAVLDVVNALEQDFSGIGITSFMMCL